MYKLINLINLSLKLITVSGTHVQPTIDNNILRLFSPTKIILAKKSKKHVNVGYKLEIPTTESILTTKYSNNVKRLEKDFDGFVELINLTCEDKLILRGNVLGSIVLKPNVKYEIEIN